MVRITAASREEESHATSFGGLRFCGGVDLHEEVILPEQFLPPMRIQHQHRGTAALLYAILGDAIRCFLEEKPNQSPKGARSAQEAEEWLFVDDENWPFSFVNICEFLGLDPSYLRRGLKAWHHCSTPTQVSIVNAQLQDLFDKGYDFAELLVSTSRPDEQSSPTLLRVKQKQMVRSLTRR